MPAVRPAIFAPLVVVLAAIASPVGLAPATAQEVLLPVQDLLYETVTRTPYLGLLGDEFLWPSRVITGENSLSPPQEGWNNQRTDRDGEGYFTVSQLQDILSAIGMAGGPRVFLGALIVNEADAEQARTVLQQLRSALPPTLTIHARLTERTGDRERVRFERHAELVPGRLNVFSDLRERQATVDFEVEIAQASMISNPMPRRVRSGTMLAVRPQLTPSAEWGLLEIITRCIDDDPSARIGTGHDSIGPIDRVPLAIAESARVVLVRPGKTTVQRWSTERGAFELTLTARWQLRPPVRVGGHDFGVFSVRGDLTGFRSVRVDFQNYEALLNPEEGLDPWSAIEDIAGSEAQWLTQPDLDETPFAERYVAIDRANWAAGAAVMRWFEARKEGPQLSIRCLDVPAGTTVDAATAAPPPDGVREVAAVSASQVDGTWSTCAVRRDYTIVTDWDCEVANSARIPDPKCTRIDVGAVFNVRRLGERYEIDGDLVREIDPGRKELKLAAAIAAPPTLQVSAQVNNVRQSTAPAMQLPADRVVIEQPQLARLPVRFNRAVPPGGRATWRATANELLGDGRELLVVLQIEK